MPLGGSSAQLINQTLENEELSNEEKVSKLFELQMLKT